MLYLKQSAATTITIGPLTDETDGVTPITSVTVGGITAAVIKGTTRTALTLTASGGVNDFTHIGDGYWSLELTAADVGTLGRLRVTLRDDDGFLPVWEDFMVLPANAYDGQFSDDRPPPGVLVETTIATVNSQTDIDLTAGPPDDGALKNKTIVFIDAASKLQVAQRTIKTYTGTSKKCILNKGPVFNVAAGDIVRVETTDDRLCGDQPQTGAVVLGSDEAPAVKLQQVAERNINGVWGDDTVLKHRKFGSTTLYDTQQPLGRTPNVSADVKNTEATP